MKIPTLKKLDRDFCIIKYRKLPLACYNKETDEEVYYYPENKAFYWIKLKNFDNQKKNTAKKLVTEIITLLQFLKFKKIIFLGLFNKPWISKSTSQRKDYKRLTKALKYFKENKIGKKFNGGVEISTENLNNFLYHYFTITRCDSGFFDYYFTDENENILFHLHYSGDLKILTLNNHADEEFKNVVKALNFINSSRNGSEKI